MKRVTIVYVLSIFFLSIKSGLCTKFYLRDNITFTNVSNEKYTLFVATNLSWTDDYFDWYQARNYCDDIYNTSLASFHNKSDINLYLSLIFTESETTLLNRGCWIGLIDEVGNNENYTWVDGTPYDYTYWQAGKPNADTQRCVRFTRYTLGYNGTWDDFTCSGGISGSLGNSIATCFVCNTKNIYSNTYTPTNSPTTIPSIDPTMNPTLSPGYRPTFTPTITPTNSPIVPPSNTPTLNPSLYPTNTPSTSPTNTPTDSPTITPSIAPTIMPSKAPTDEICDEIIQTRDTNLVCYFLSMFDTWPGNLTLTEPNFCNANNSFFVCDDENIYDIIEINLSQSGISGNINSTMLKLLPNTIEILNLSNNNLDGTIGFWDEIYRFKKIDLSNNLLTGNVDFSQIDYEYNTDSSTTISTTQSIGSISVLTELYLNNNNLDEQSIEWDDFGDNFPNLKILDLSSNSFTGTIEFSGFNNIEYLNLGNNLFIEIYGFDDLSDQEYLVELYLNDNEIRETFASIYLPSNLEIFECSNNILSGLVLMNDIPKSLINFKCANNSFGRFEWDSAQDFVGEPYALTQVGMLQLCLS